MRIFSKNIHIRSLLVDILNLFLLQSKRKKIYILVFIAALPLFILAWFGMLVSPVVCFFAGLAGFILIISIIYGLPYDYLSIIFSIFLLVIGVISVFSFRSLLKTLQLLSKSGEFLFELLLLTVGAILGLWALTYMVTWTIVTSNCFPYWI